MSQTDQSRQHPSDSSSGTSSPQRQDSTGREERPKPPSPDEFLAQLKALPADRKVEMLASLFFTVSDIAAFIGMPADELRLEVTCMDTELARAYRRGTLDAQVKLRYQDMIFAGAGSPAALEAMMGHLSEQKQDENA